MIDFKLKVESDIESNHQERFLPKEENATLSTENLLLKIGYDGKRATNNATGLGNYSRSLIEGLTKTFKHTQHFLYTPKLKQAVVQLPFFQLKSIFIRSPAGFWSTFLWRSVNVKNVLKADKIDIYHGLSNEIPVGLKKVGIKSVVTIHDLIFLKRPQDYGFINRFIYRFKSKYACQNADKIIAISAQTKTDIIDCYQITPDKIEVIYQTCDAAFKQAVSKSKKDEVREKYQLPANYILSVGTIEPRKNLLLTIKALAKTQTNIPLVVVGKAKPYFKEVEQEIINQNLQQRVIFLKNVSFADLPSIYQMANLFIYPSFYEGFGIPIIEALFSKVPVIAAKGSCLEEAGGPDSLYVNPDDAVDLVNKIDEVLGNADVAQKMIEKGYHYVQKFDNQSISHQLMRCYLQTLHK